MKIPNGFELRRISFEDNINKTLARSQRFWAEKPPQIKDYVAIGIYNGIGFENYGCWHGTESEIRKARKKDRTLNPKLEEILLLACSLCAEPPRANTPNSNHYALAKALLSLSDQGHNITDFVVKYLRRDDDTGIITYEVVAVGYSPMKIDVVKAEK